MISPNLLPKKKFKESPPIDAARNMMINRPIFNPYVALADSAAAANRSESPGRNGKITAPVSIKITANRIKYVESPNVFTIFMRWLSICRIKSISVLK